MKVPKPGMTQMVFVVDDDPAVCAGLCDLLDSAGISARHFDTAEAFLNYWTPEIQGCILLDVRLPGMSGMELQERLISHNLSIPAIIMTAHGDIPMVRKAFISGAADFLVKPFPDGELLHALERVFAAQRNDWKETGEFNSICARIQSLTAREREVMEFVAAGITNKVMAEKLHLQIVTIKLHRGQMMRKMKAKSVPELVRMVDLAKRKDGLTRANASTLRRA